MSDFVSFSEEEQYCLIQMDDGKANAIGFAMLEQLNAALDQAEATGKPLVLAGRPGKFSAGFDLSIMGQGGPDQGTLLRGGANLALRLLQHPTPVVLAVSGHALAMGGLMCLSGDYRIGIKGDFKIGLNEVAIGMTLPYFGIELARNRLLKNYFDRAVNMAEIYDAEGAVDAGYLDEAVEGDALLERAAAVASSYSALNMAAHRNTKARTREGLVANMQRAIAEDTGEV